ncbi:MAG TPA: hypothetical protein V6C76_14130 [Drouetiella sp.]
MVDKFESWASLIIGAELRLSLDEVEKLAARKSKRVRSQFGSALSEFGPAFFLLLVFGLLPLIDAVFVGIDYASAYYLNEMQLREAQKLPKSQATATNGIVISNCVNTWRGGLLGGTCDTDNLPVTTVEYYPVPWQPVGGNQQANFWFVSVSTQVSFRPFLKIPFLNGIPGLGAPVQFTVAGRRPVENNRFLNE